MNSGIKMKLVPSLGFWLIRVLGRTLRIATKDRDRVEEFHRRGQGVIIAFWHGRQLMMPLAYRGKEAHILISQHRDGELIHRIVSRFGFQAVRGSTTRGGWRALRQLVRIAKRGGDLVITPDGPKGPRYVVQQGIIGLAKLTGFPIVPLTFACSKKKSSTAGIDLFFLIRGEKAYLCGGNLSG